MVSKDLERGLAELLLVDTSRPSFDKSYTLAKKLMSGSYGTVYAGVHISTQKEVAIKVVDRRLVNISFHITCHFAKMCSNVFSTTILLAN